MSIRSKGTERQKFGEKKAKLVDIEPILVLDKGDKTTQSRQSHKEKACSISVDSKSRMQPSIEG
jgi:hypothetical protein